MEIQTVGYSIWLEPEGQLKEQIDQQIQIFAQENNTPSFNSKISGYSDSFIQNPGFSRNLGKTGHFSIRINPA